jgi:electron transfer flavoprotein alpha subunit
VITASELSTDPSVFGFAGSPTSVNQIYSIETKRRNEIIQGPTSEEKISRLVDKLLAEGLFTGWKDTEENGIKPPDSRRITSDKAFWVVAELVQGRVRNVTYQLLGRGLELAGKLGGELSTVTFGKITNDQVHDLIEHGSDKVYTINHTELSAYSSDAYADALTQLINKYNPFAVITSETSFGRDFMPRVAAQLGLGMTSDCIGLEIDDQGQVVQLKPAFGGNIVAPILSRTVPQFATVRPGMFTPSSSNSSRRGSLIEFIPIDIRPLSRVIEERFEADQAALRLDNADVIVSAGAGVGGPEHMNVINELAEILNAPVATTRKVVDLGWLPRQLQVGLTGRSVAPKLYIAVTVRGAFNHMVGVGRAKTIVAINNDPNALIFKNCDYGIVGDFAEIVPLLSKKLYEAKRKALAQSLKR